MSKVNISRAISNSLIPTFGLLLAVYGLIMNFNFVIFDGKYIGLILFTLFNISLLSYLNLSTKKTIERFVKGIIVFLMGNLIISGLVLSLTNLFLGLSQIQAVIISYIIGLLILISISIIQIYNSSSEETRPRLSFKEKYSLTIITLIILTISGIALFILNGNLSLQQSINIDTFHHLTAIKEIYFNNNLGLLLTNINETFTLATYLPFFHYIFGVPLSTGELIDTVLLYRILEIMFTLTSSLVVYHGINALTKSKPLSIFAAILHIFAFESFGAYTTHFLLPQTLTGLMSFSLIIYVLKTEKINRALLEIGLILLGLNHFFIGIFAVLAVLIILFIRKFHKSVISIVSISIAVSILLFIGADLLSLSVLDGVGQIFTDLAERKSELTNLGTIDILNVFFRSFGLVSIIILIQLFLSPFAKSWKYKAIGLLLIFTMAIISIEFPYGNKLLILVHYFSIIFMSIGFANINVFYKWRSLILIAIIAVGLSFGLQANTQRFKYIFTGEYGHIHLMDYEYLIAEDILVQKNTDERILVISDPLTMHMIEPISDVKTTGGLFSQIDKTKEVWNILNANIEVYEKEIDKRSDSIYVSELPQESDLSFIDEFDGVFVIITPRTLLWLNEEEEFIEGYGNQIWRVGD
jgi:hypothetical protein